MQKRSWHRYLVAVALIVNIAGTACLWWSFQATSSNFRLISAEDVTARGRPSAGARAYSICVDKLELGSIDSTQSTYVGTGGCTLWDKGAASAIPSY
jgi:hypothetical protein